MNSLSSLVLFVSLASATSLPSTALSAPVAPAPAASVKAVAPVKATVSASFKGAEVNGGTVAVSQRNGRAVLTLSDDFKIPAAPAPHWQIVDGEGNVFLLQRLTIVGDKTHREIVLPKYVRSIARVQIWCAFAEVLLGETSFGRTVKLG